MQASLLVLSISHRLIPGLQRRVVAMARKKVRLAWIQSDVARKATYKKRKKGMIKKIAELTTLCDVTACAIIHGPGDEDVELWPSAIDVHRIVLQFKSLPESEQNKKMMNQEGFFRQRVTKLTDQLNRHQRENRNAEMTELMWRCITGEKSVQEFNIVELEDLGWVVEGKMKEVHARIQAVSKATATAALGAMHTGTVPAPVLVPVLVSSPPPPPESQVVVGGTETNGEGRVGSKEMEGMELGDLNDKNPWYLELLDSQGNIGCGPSQVPFGECSPWFDPLFP